MSEPDLPEIRISQGLLRGRKKISVCDQVYYSFLGIPYAKPPIGELRFRAPRPPSNWFGIRDASREGNVSVQLSPHPSKAGHDMVGDEDCLYINVFTPSLPTLNGQTTLKPVMVWVHYGAFSYGSGNPDFFGPDYLLERDVIVVTFNYRLGALGFLNLNIREATGNAGMKDQVAALKWVKKEIKHFGGDPDNVTLFGESSGGGSIQLHLLSPCSRGLFHKCIIQSSSAYCNWAFSYPDKSRSSAVRLASILGCESTEPKVILNFLKKCPAQKLIWAQHGIASAFESASSQYFLFTPTYEKHFDLDEPFLTEDPRVLLKSGDFYKVPTIVGYTAEEGFLNFICIPNSFLNHYPKSLNRIVPHILPPTQEIGNVAEISKKLRDRYFSLTDDTPFGEMTQDHPAFYPAIQFFTDTYFEYPIIKSVLDMLPHMTSTTPIYLYLFNHTGPLGWSNRRSFIKLTKPVSTHGDELGYLFHISVLEKPKLPPDSPELLMISRMTQYWTNFAKTGNPNPAGLSKLFPIEWKPVSSKEDMKMLNIGINLHETDSFEGYNFWNDIVKDTRQKFEI